LPFTNKRGVSVAAAVLGLGLAAAACGSSSSGASSTPNTTPSTAATVPDISATSFTQDFSAMAQLKGLAAQGKGNIGVLLPDTVTSARYVEFDAPLLTKAFQTAGLTSSQFTVQNAHGDAGTQFTQAQSDITGGATVLILDPFTPVVGAQIEKFAKAHGVQTIDYDRLTLGGDRDYYVSFDNVKVGKIIGNGFKACLTADHVPSPKLIKMVGDPTDNNATLFNQGYTSVISANPSWTVLAKPAGTWTPSVALTEFQGALTANPTANSAIIPNDENAAPIINYLKNKGIKPNTFPITGQDATSIGLQNVLLGYQCGTAYKPVYIEAQAAAATALYLRANQPVPADLANATTEDTTSHTAVKSIYLQAEWVTPKNMQATVVKDGSVPANQICTTAALKAACTANGIS
jgi:D-xylose transport system substrate-binding protein